MTLICNFAVAFLRLTRLGSIEFRPALVCAASPSLSSPLSISASFRMFFFAALFGKLIGLHALIGEVGAQAAKLFMAFALTIFIEDPQSERIASKALRTLQCINSDREREGGREIAHIKYAY